MKKFFEYVGLTALFLFSYYYTSKIGEFMSDKDTIMVSLEEKNELLNSQCTEGYMNNEGVILGISGLVIDMEKSYQNMKGLGYEESLIEYKEIMCAINKKNSLDKYILKGNPYKNSVSVIIKLTNLEYLDAFVTIANEKNINIDLLVDDSIFNLKKDTLLNYSKNMNILYNGNDLRNFKNTFKKTYCVYTENSELIKMCEKENINTIKSNKTYDKEALLNIKTDLEKGDFIILNENKQNLSEFSSLINYIKSKGLEIISIEEHLK